MQLKSNKHNRSIYLPVHSCQTSVLQYVLHWFHWPHVLSGCLFGHYSFRSLGGIACFSYSGVLYKHLRTFCFLFRQTSAIFISPSMHSGTFWSKEVFKYCVYFFIIWWLLSSKERVQWALHLFPFFFGSRCNSLKEDRYGSSKQKAAILYPTMHFVSSRTQTFIWQEKCQTLFTCLVLKYLPLASLRLFQGF